MELNSHSLVRNISQTIYQEEIELLMFFVLAYGPLGAE